METKTYNLFHTTEFTELVYEYITNPYCRPIDFISAETKCDDLRQAFIDDSAVKEAWNKALSI